jgi:tetratricopeptide (TPR) repeat protein
MPSAETGAAATPSTGTGAAATPSAEAEAAASPPGAAPAAGAERGQDVGGSSWRESPSWTGDSATIPTGTSASDDWSAGVSSSEDGPSPTSGGAWSFTPSAPAHSWSFDDGAGQDYRPGASEGSSTSQDDQWSATPFREESWSEAVGPDAATFGSPGAGLPPERESDDQSRENERLWTAIPGAAAEITGEIVTGEIVVGEIGTGEVIRAEVIIAAPPASKFPAAEPDDPGTGTGRPDADLTDAAIAEDSTDTDWADGPPAEQWLDPTDDGPAGPETAQPENDLAGVGDQPAVDVLAGSTDASPDEARSADAGWTYADRADATSADPDPFEINPVGTSAFERSPADTDRADARLAAEAGGRITNESTEDGDDPGVGDPLGAVAIESDDAEVGTLRSGDETVADELGAVDATPVEDPAADDTEQGDRVADEVEQSDRPADEPEQSDRLADGSEQSDHNADDAEQSDDSALKDRSTSATSVMADDLGKIADPPTGLEDFSAGESPSRDEAVEDAAATDESAEDAPATDEAVGSVPATDEAVEVRHSSQDEPETDLEGAQGADTDGNAETPDDGGSAGDGHGLGWLLEMSGLGAISVDPEPEPDDDVPPNAEAEAQTTPDTPTEPLAEEPVSASPVSGAPAKQDWFAPVTDPRMAVPDTARTDAGDQTEGAEPEGAEPEAEEPETSAEAGTTADKATTAETDGPGLEIDDTGNDDAPAAAAESTPEPDPKPTDRPADNEPAESPVSDAADTTDGDESGKTDDDQAKPADASTPDDASKAADHGSGGAAAPAGAGAGSPARQQRGAGEEPERRLVDPELVLSTYPWRFDPETLRELVDDPDQLRSVRDRLTDKVEYVERDAVRARLLSLRAVVSRVLGDLGRAVTDGRDALRHAEATGELRRIAIAQARLAHVLQWNGDFEEADRLFLEADSVELPDRLRAEVRELAGRSAFDQGRYLEAFNAFEEALDLRKGADEEMVARIEVALDAVLSRVGDKGWGPFPRTRDEILQKHRAPAPAYDERSGLWGYPGAILPYFVDAQSFHEGVAWIRRPNVPMWELINERGDLLIDASAGYRGATAYAEGLAWVTREGVGGWFAIDQRNRVIVPGGFEDVRPFHRGVAPVRRGAWGAIDRHGRMVLQPKYRAFATVLSGGRGVDGFTDEGLAVVDAGDRYGVVDRTGQLLVAPVHAALVIHPVAFLIADRQGHWGALDRNGDPLIDFVHANERYVTEAIERLLVDTRPVL